MPFCFLKIFASWSKNISMNLQNILSGWRILSVPRPKIILSCLVLDDICLQHMLPQHVTCLGEINNQFTTNWFLLLCSCRVNQYLQNWCKLKLLHCWKISIALLTSATAIMKNGDNSNDGNLIGIRLQK